MIDYTKMNLKIFTDKQFGNNSRTQKYFLIDYMVILGKNTYLIRLYWFVNNK